MDSINGISYYLNKCQTLSNTSQMTDFLSGREHGAHALCVQYSPTTAKLSTSFLLNHDPTPQQTAPSWTHWFQDLGSHTAAWVWVVSQKDWKIKERLVELWQCTDIAFEWKIRFSCFPDLPGSAEAQVIWGDTVNCLLIAYFIRNISAKKYQNAFTYVKVNHLSKPEVGRFLRHSVHVYRA